MVSLSFRAVIGIDARAGGRPHGVATRKEDQLDVAVEVRWRRRSVTAQGWQTPGRPPQAAAPPLPPMRRVPPGAPARSRGRRRGPSPCARRRCARTRRLRSGAAAGPSTRAAGRRPTRVRGPPLRRPAPGRTRSRPGIGRRRRGCLRSRGGERNAAAARNRPAFLAREQ